MSNDPVALAIAAAQAAAASAAQVSAPAALAVPQTGAVASATPMALSMGSMMGASMTVDLWIKPKEYGLVIGTAAELVTTPVVATIDMVENRGFVLKYGIKGGNPAQYKYTSDGATCTSGGSWEQAQAMIRALDNKASPYRCVDLPFTLLEDVKVKDKTIAEAGKKLGYTTSTTNWKNWEQFYKDVEKAGLMGQVVKVELTSERLTNKNANAWGVLVMKLVGAV